MSADYDKLTGFFEDLDLYLSRLKILEKWIPPIAELEIALVQVLTSVLVLCGICAKYIKMKRLGTYALQYTLSRKQFLAIMLLKRLIADTPSNIFPSLFYIII